MEDRGGRHGGVEKFDRIKYRRLDCLELVELESREWFVWERRSGDQGGELLWLRQSSKNAMSLFVRVVTTGGFWGKQDWNFHLLKCQIITP